MSKTLCILHTAISIMEIIGTHFFIRKAIKFMISLFKKTENKEFMSPNLAVFMHSASMMMQKNKI